MALSQLDKEKVVDSILQDIELIWFEEFCKTIAIQLYDNGEKLEDMKAVLKLMIVEKTPEKVL